MCGSAMCELIGNRFSWWYGVEPRRVSQAWGVVQAFAGIRSSRRSEDWRAQTKLSVEDEDRFGIGRGMGGIRIALGAPGTLQTGLLP